MANNTITRTFQEESDFGDLMDWVMNQIPTEDKEIIYSGASPSMDVVTRLKRKIQITIKDRGQEFEVSRS